jgi:hypothetical protein
VRLQLLNQFPLAPLNRSIRDRIRSNKREHRKPKRDRAEDQGNDRSKLHDLYLRVH